MSRFISPLPDPPWKKNVNKLLDAISLLPQEAKKDWLEGGLVERNKLIPNGIKPDVKTLLQIGPAPLIVTNVNALSAPARIAKDIKNTPGALMDIAGGAGQNLSGPLSPFKSMAVGYGATALSNLYGKATGNNTDPIKTYQAGFDWANKARGMNKILSRISINKPGRNGEGQFLKKAGNSVPKVAPKTKPIQWIGGDQGPLKITDWRDKP